MLFYVYLASLFAALTVIQAETVPSAITCAPGQGSPILKDDCKKAFAKFFKESGIVYWSRGADSESCGTCKITLTKPSMRTNSVHRAG
ncbi:hypothetical protein Pst134EA_022795 [Puccinia striiformis f. sp. tritici]|nr:hypothetical protein Pst134EA_022795 [Puccinia striiformis f. sp. tritici]KAH9455324.1 hypothetical protein Pst134EA_022795 [Puccinia striiformis f. sp. tritici]